MLFHNYGFGIHVSVEVILKVWRARSSNLSLIIISYKLMYNIRQLIL